MAITNQPEHKYAFLYTNDNSDRYLKDLENVYITLREYYNYPENNIRIVFGATIPTLTAYTKLDSAPAATKKAVATEAELTAVFEGVGDSISDKILNDPDPPTAGDVKSFVLYFTGSGDDNSMDIVPGVSFDRTYLEDRFGRVIIVPPFPVTLSEKCQVHLIMQQAKGESFAVCVDGLADKSFTAACGSTEASPGGNAANGSYFTDGWTRALQFEKLPATAPTYPNKFADEIDLTPGNQLVSIDQARKFSIDFHATTPLNSNPITNDSTNADPYMGKHGELSIKDGDEDAPPRAWWESPDIWIINSLHTAEDNDYYVYDESNDIHIRVHLDGTHPYRSIYLGAKVFISGGGGAGELHTANFEPAPALKAGGSSTYDYPYTFASPHSHRCIKARASITSISNEDIDDLDTVGGYINEWDPHTLSYEAQRNTDPTTLKSGGSGGGAGAEEPETGNGNVDEEAPEEEAKPETDNPETDADTITTRNLRRSKEHIYVIKNNFRYKRDFRYKIDPELFKREKELFFKWCRIDAKDARKYQKLKPEMKPYPHLAFELNPGEEAHIVNHIGLNKGIKLKKPLNLEFEIEMGYLRIARFFIWRLKPVRKMRFRRYSGVTMKLTDGSFSMKGKVVNREGKPVSDVVVIAKTINGRQSAATLASSKGEWIFKDINPDIYRVYAIYKRKPSKELIIHGMPTDKKPDRTFEIKL